MGCCQPKFYVLFVSSFEPTQNCIHCDTVLIAIFANILEKSAIVVSLPPCFNHCAAYQFLISRVVDFFMKVHALVQWHIIVWANAVFIVFTQNLSILLNWGRLRLAGHSHWIHLWQCMHRLHWHHDILHRLHLRNCVDILILGSSWLPICDKLDWHISIYRNKHLGLCIWLYFTVLVNSWPS